MKIRTLFIGAWLGISPIISLTAQSTWEGGDGAFETPEAWAPDGSPASTTPFSINSGTVTRTGNLPRAAETTLEGTATLILNGRLENADGGAATLNIRPGATLNQNGNYFLVGKNNAGVINQSGGSVTSTIDRGWFFSDTNTSSGTYNLTGGSLNVTTSGSVSANSAYAVHVGKASTSDNLIVNGGSAVFRATAENADPRFYISNASTMRVEVGSVEIDDFRFFIVGRDGNISTQRNKLYMLGGTFELTLRNNGAFIIGAANEGELHLNGGSLKITGADMWVGDGRSGFVTQTDGILELGTQNLVLARQGAEAQSIYTMEGGSISANDITVGAGGSGVFNFNGGEIFLESDRTALLTESWFNGADGATATFDPLSGKTHFYFIPEPSTAVLTLLGLVGILRRRVS